jgi:hypothetical protein
LAIYSRYVFKSRYDFWHNFRITVQLKQIVDYLIHLQKQGGVRYFFIFLLVIFSGAGAAGQKDTSDHKNDSLPDRFYILQNVKRDGESLPEIEIKEITVVGPRSWTERFQDWRYDRLISNVKRVYPYSLIVREKLKEVNTELEKITNEKERRKYLNRVEKQVFKDYEDDMRHMTITQGRLLIKLIDRETENTSYDLIKEYRGKISASFWQGIARIFGTNLKEKYNPAEDDFLIEVIIMDIEAGRL